MSWIAGFVAIAVTAAGIVGVPPAVQSGVRDKLTAGDVAVVDPSGRSASGVIVQLLEEPPSAEILDRKGFSFSLALVQEGVTPGNGIFSLRTWVTNQAALGRNYRIVAFDPVRNLGSVYFFTGPLDRAVELRLASAEIVAPPPPGEQSGTRDSSPRSQQVRSTLLDSWAKQTVAGPIFVDRVGVKATYTLRTGSTWALGVGVSNSGKYGSFRAGGEVESSTSKEVSNDSKPWRGTNARFFFRTTWKWGHFEDTYMYCTRGGSCRFWSSYSIRPIAHNGGLTTVRAPSLPVTKTEDCAEQMKNSSVTISTGTAMTWLGAAEVLGFGVSSRVGWSANASTSFTFLSDGFLCSTPQGGAVVARKTSS